MSDELTVEKCLEELREMFPEFEREIRIVEAPRYLRPKVYLRVHGQSTTHPSLVDCMAIARRWKQSQEQER